MSEPDKQRRKELRASAAPRQPLRFFSYGRGPTYRVAHACFRCRRSFKIADDFSEPTTRTRPCPSCAEPLHWMGRSFKAPKWTDEEQWMKVKALWDAGFRFQSYRSAPEAEPLPTKLREVADFIRRNPDHPMRVKAPSS